MKALLTCLVLALSASCATSPKHHTDFDPKLNCTPRALELLNKMEKPDMAIIKAQERYRHIIRPHLDRVLSCYKDSDETVTSQNFNPCMVMELGPKGKIVELIVEDQLNPMPNKLMSCVMTVFGNIDYQPVLVPGIYSVPLRMQTPKK